jgi:hypothetical protein
VGREEVHVRKSIYGGLRFAYIHNEFNLFELNLWLPELITLLVPRYYTLAPDYKIKMVVSDFHAPKPTEVAKSSS